MHEGKAGMHDFPLGSQLYISPALEGQALEARNG
jgi:hypothetical protein